MTAPAAPKPHFRSVGAFVERWLLPTLAGKRAAAGGGSGRVWCPEWWRHPQVAVRLTALWLTWEAARASGTADAMSTWWLHHADPHLRVLCDADNGPMYRCTTRHHDLPPYPSEPVPPGWFDDE
ncbi:DUF4913 domain-containing protein [Nocardia panacis]|uniref:DUF4913 domain-containing protein n=1 Tax=Nocardia panacis TaxID=2340916 RepID=A0A3A4KPF2_9NOCA|nr:DUF4913 domain-containing protein [Nocardia panacis]RJO77646.1 DUF4913 domain-containing protein [Nocardia panacis]